LALYSVEQRTTVDLHDSFTNIGGDGSMKRRNARGAEVLQKLLDARGWTGHTLHQHTRIAEETISKWLADSVPPGRRDLLALRSVFNEGDWGELANAYGAQKLARNIRAIDPPDSIIGGSDWR
jgi:hypothetical protein